MIGIGFLEDKVGFLKSVLSQKELNSESGTKSPRLALPQTL